MIERRLLWLAGIVFAWGAAILSKLVHYQLFRYQEFRETARRRQELVVEVPAARGPITDRHGSPLALSVPTESVFVNPLRLPDLEVAAEILSGVLDLDRAALGKKLAWARTNSRGFLWIKRKISFEEGRRLRSLKLDWIDFQAESQRHYPKGSIAAHVIGSVDHDQRGNSGLERALDEELRGEDGQIRLLTDVRRRGVESRPDAEARPGVSLTLSLDERLQFFAEKELAAAVRNANAARGSVVALNPINGEVLVMASYPSFDPNKPPQPGEPKLARQNQAIEAPFEPGSVFKVITISSALETTNLRPESPIPCGNGRITLFGRTIHEAKDHGYGTIPMEMVLAKSSNIGAIQVGMKVGESNLKEYIRSFGFGQKTGIPLPAESAGKVRRKWGKTSLGSVAMGHELSTTTLQLAQACAVVANGGLLVSPRLVLRKNGEPVPSLPPRRVLKPDNAIAMRRMMETVVVNGTGRRARLDGYRGGGKTGSAQIYDFDLRRFTHSYNASYMGFAPLVNPAVAIVVTINGTHGTAGFGGAVAAPVFRAIATEALRVLDVPKDLPDASPSGPQAPPKDAQNDLAIADLGSPDPPILQEAAEEERLAAAMQGPALPPSMQAAGPKVPDFHGMTMRRVMAEAAEKGLPVLPDGSGIARVQYPPPGAVLREGERIRVQFAR